MGSSSLFHNLCIIEAKTLYIEGYKSSKNYNNPCSTTLFFFYKQPLYKQPALGS